MSLLIAAATAAAAAADNEMNLDVKSQPDGATSQLDVPDHTPPSKPKGKCYHNVYDLELTCV